MAGLQVVGDAEACHWIGGSLEHRAVLRRGVRVPVDLDGGAHHVDRPARRQGARQGEGAVLRRLAGHAVSDSTPERRLDVGGRDQRAGVHVAPARRVWTDGCGSRGRGGRLSGGGGSACRDRDHAHKRKESERSSHRVPQEKTSAVRQALAGDIDRTVQHRSARAVRARRSCSSFAPVPSSSLPLRRCWPISREVLGARSSVGIGRSTDAERRVRDRVRTIVGR